MGWADYNYTAGARKGDHSPAGKALAAAVRFESSYGSTYVSRTRKRGGWEHIDYMDGGSRTWGVCMDMEAKTLRLFVRSTGFDLKVRGTRPPPPHAHCALTAPVACS